MKRNSFLLWSVIVVIMVICGMNPLLSRSEPLTGDTVIRATVKLNGSILQDSVYLRITSGGPQVEARSFISLLGGSFHPFSPVFHQYGFMVQYGRFISFTGLGFARGLCNLQLVSMVPPSSSLFISGDSVYFAPLPFLALAIGGTITYDAVAVRLEITVAPPQGFGSIFLPAGAVAQALIDSGYMVQQGEISKQNPIDFCLGGYTSNANGNNAGVPYFGIQLPPSSDMDSLYSPPVDINIKEDEAMVLIGRTPPECIYYSYRSYLMNRLYDFPEPTTRTKINASLGDTKSLYRMREDLPTDSMFNRKYALIMAADSLVAMNIKNIILASTPEIAAGDIFFDILPGQIFRFGTDPQADWCNYLHRVSLIRDSAAQNSYVNNPPLEILRVTPKNTSSPLLFSLHPFLPRACGVTEFSLLPDVELLEEGIYKAYHMNYEIIWLQPTPWTTEGFTAIQEGADALGDNHDALYIESAYFQFRENDIALVYGVNHTKTGKAVYTNACIYGKKYMNGFGGITNFEMEKSARQYMADTVLADKLVAYCFARHPIPGNPYVYIVPSDTNGTLEGINVNDTASIGFRLYVNTLTKIGADPLEVILDRTVLLRPFSAGITENEDRSPSPAMKVYPNPFTDKTILEFSLPEWSDLTLTLFNPSGQKVGTTLRIDHVRGTVLQEMKPGGNLVPGIYYLHGIVSEKEGSGKYTLTSKLVFSQ